MTVRRFIAAALVTIVVAGCSGTPAPTTTSTTEGTYMGAVIDRTRQVAEDAENRYQDIDQ